VVEVRVLGPVEVVLADGHSHRVVGQRPATVLLTLALAGRATVSAERLVREVWGEQAPPTAVESLQSHLSRLRRTLEPERVAHAPSTVLLRAASGYRLAPETVVDARVFEERVTSAREQLARGRARPAARQLREALELWRGEAGEGLELTATNRAEVRRLEELRLAALETRCEAALELGEHADVAIELEALVARHPVREHLHALLMLALYRSGRQAEALATYRRARAQLVEALGVEPSRALTALHDRILGHDPALDPPVAGLRAPGEGARGSRGGDAVRGATAQAQVAGDAVQGVTAQAPVPGAAAVLGNLPAPLVELIGRDEQRRAIAAALGPHRLVTLTGAGGCGKTQLALAVAHRVADSYPDGAWWVDLQAWDEPEHVAGAIAQQLGVDEVPEAALADALTARLEQRHALLVLDNCEHVIDGCAVVVRELLLRCPALHVLTTSRQPLDLEGERVWRVPSLGVPAADADLAGVEASESGQLLLRRGSAARPDLQATEEDASALATICRELDGIPLALELAAARLRVLSIEELAARLDDRFQVLRSSRRGGPSRHRTLEAAIGWSFELLEPAAQRLLSRLTIFRSGPSLEAIEVVCADASLPRTAVLGLLEDLVDRSLVITVPRAVGPVSHDMLQSIRSFAAQRLEPAEAHALRARHATWYAELAGRAGERLTGAEQVRWLNRLHDEHDDLRSALEWSLQHDRLDLAAQVCAGVWWFWLQFGHAREGADWLERVLALHAAEPGPGSAAEQAPHALELSYAAGRLWSAIGDRARARDHLERGAALARRSDDACALALCEARLLQLEQDTGPATATGPTQPPGASGPTQPPDADRAVQRSHADRAAELWHRHAGCDDTWVSAVLAEVAGHLAVAAGDLDAAAAAFHRSEQQHLAVEDRWSACLARLGRAWVARRQRRWVLSLQLHLENLEATRALTRSAYDFIGLARDLRGVAAAASALGSHAEAARLYGASENLRSLADVALAPDERQEIEVMLGEAREALGTRTAEEEQIMGWALSPVAALDLAAGVATGLIDEHSEQREAVT